MPDPPSECPTHKHNMPSIRTPRATNTIHHSNTLHHLKNPPSECHYPNAQHSNTTRPQQSTRTPRASSTIHHRNATIRMPNTPTQHALNNLFEHPAPPQKSTIGMPRSECPTQQHNTPSTIYSNTPHHLNNPPSECHYPNASMPDATRRA
jgi:hypothetical protein